MTHIDPDGAQDGWVPSTTGATALSEPVGAQTWFPNNNTPRDKATFDVALTVPKKLAAASNGVLRSRQDLRRQDDLELAPAASRWRPTSRWSRSATSTSTARRSSSSTVGRSPRGRFVAARASARPRRSASCCRRSCAFSEKQYGRYPFDGTGMVIQDLDVGYALETQTRPFFDGVPDDATLVHELAHQWFGDSVTPRDWGDIWLNEGFATYAEANWAAEHGGPTTWQAFQKTYDANDASSDLWKPAPNALKDPADLFGEPGLRPRRPDPGGPAAPDRRREDADAAAHLVEAPDRGVGPDEPVRRAGGAGQRPGPRRLLPDLAEGGGEAEGLLSRRPGLRRRSARPWWSRRPPAAGSARSRSSRP